MEKAKGQAALEYLMTYGWAILVVLAIISILIYVVRPQYVETCNVALPFQCVPEYYKIDTNGNLTLRLRNVGTTRFVINSTKCGNSVKVYGKEDKILASGGTVDLEFNCSEEVKKMGTVTPGKDIFKTTLEITYYPYGSPEYSKKINIEVGIKFS
ncbi:MAG: hypothetical protein QXI58_04715 [Candidatus Micrarchaeia archaeon]